MAVQDGIPDGIPDEDSNGIPHGVEDSSRPGERLWWPREVCSARARYQYPDIPIVGVLDLAITGIARPRYPSFINAILTTFMNGLLQAVHERPLSSRS